MKFKKTIWIHALAAKVGGGVTYLRNVLPQLAEQLAGRGVRVILLLPAPLDLSLPEFFDVRVLPRWARNPLTRFVFDQFVWPLMVWREGGDALFCSASFAPVVKPARTVVLLRNAIYFDPNLIGRETPARSLSWRLQSLLIAAGAYSCAAVMYPGEAMRAQVEACFPSLRPRGLVNPYGVAEVFATGNAQGKGTPHPAPCTPQFLYVMTYTLQKNLNFLLRALIQAKAEGVPVQLVVTSRLDDRPPACHEADRRLIEEHDLIGAGYLRPVGPHYGTDLIALYQAVDACIFASFCESFGHPLVEALALGKPLVCADWPYAREICGGAAVYFDPTRPEDLVALWRGWPATYQPAETLDREAFLARFSWAGHTARLLRSLGVEPAD